MNELAQLHCSRVTADTPRLTEKEINQALTGLPGWGTHVVEGEPRLEKSFQFKNFGEALLFTDRVGKLAEEEDHHPAILTEWGRVTVTWWTHRIKGLHQNDFIMAAKTDHLLP
jgi:4a-hydroxytetrahydrobiopterin dehydratase